MSNFRTIDRQTGFVLPPRWTIGCRKSIWRASWWLCDGGVFQPQAGTGTYDSVAFRFIAANDHPDHDTIAAFRRRFLKEIEALFVHILQLAREMGVLKMGTIGLDGTKIRR